MWVHKIKPPELSWNFEICPRNTSIVHIWYIYILINDNHTQMCYYTNGQKPFSKLARYISMRKLQHRRYSPACDLTVFFILQAIFSAVKKISIFSFYRHSFFSHLELWISVKKMLVKRKWCNFLTGEEIEDRKTFLQYKKNSQISCRCIPP